MKKWNVILGAAVCSVLYAGSASAADTVKKTAETFDDVVWQNSPWNSGVGTVGTSDEVAPGVNSKKSMRVDAKFSGTGFEAVTVNPPQPLTIPGAAKSITLRIKRGDPRYLMKMAFADGWGRPTPEWELPLRPEAGWQTVTFKVPQDWVQPIRIEGIVTHNWEAKGAAITVTNLFDQLEAETDVRQVDPATGVLKTWHAEPNPADPAKALKEAPKTPLVSVEMSTGVESNVFAGEEPKVVIQVRNWKDQPLTGKASCQVLDEAGKPVVAKDLSISADSVASYALPLPVEKYGRYSLKASLSLSDGTKRDDQMVFAKLPPLKELTEQQKIDSPYGINVHGAAKVVVMPFKKAGLVWFREYAFQWDWLMRAKGADKRYAGWPYFPKIVNAHADAGVKIMPVLQRSVVAPQLQDGKVVGRVGPDENWGREIAQLVLAFPQITHWELSNEYDLPNSNVKAEEAVNWANYRAYHKKFGDIISLLSGGKNVVVENGRAGIWPKRVKECVMSGDFANIDVVNSHHYCGTDAPEVNIENYNMGFDASEQQMGSLYDILRAAKQAGQADGKKRQSYFTEFGWDTLAGPVVSPFEQAVFLQRGWMLAMAAGTDKAFWFYNFDAADPKNFFDGCGLLAVNAEPKLSLCAMAGMTSILPSPKFVGSLNAGDNTWGYVFENEGKLVATLFTIKGEDGPTVNFKAEQLYDYLGNKLPGSSVKLGMAPVYAVGLNKGDAWLKQTAYGLKTPLMVGASGGDLVTPVIEINNTRQQAIGAKVQIVLPDGWKAQTSEVYANVPADSKREVPVPFTVALLESPGLKDVKLVISEGEKLKEMPLRVMVQPAMTMQVSPIIGKPGPASATVKLMNLSAQPQNATLQVKTPSSWKVSNPTVAVNDLKPQEQRTIKIDVSWDPNWKTGESATVQLDAAGRSMIEPLIPNQLRMHAAKGIKMDADLSDWAPQMQIPEWVFGSTLGKPQAKVYMAWAKEGIYGAIQVKDSKVSTKNPKSFWAGDALEMFVDTRGEKSARQFQAGDHQFWFVPLVNENRVYTGQWKHDAEIADNVFDLPGVQSAAKATSDGYVMEFLLPAAAIKQYQPSAGGKIGLNLNLTVFGQKSNREVYWPASKSAGTYAHPEQWGTVELAD